MGGNVVKIVRFPTVIGEKWRIVGGNVVKIERFPAGIGIV